MSLTQRSKAANDTASVAWRSRRLARVVGSAPCPAGWPAGRQQRGKVPPPPVADLTQIYGRDVHRAWSSERPTDRRCGAGDFLYSWRLCVRARSYLPRSISVEWLPGAAVLLPTRGLAADRHGTCGPADVLRIRQTTGTMITWVSLPEQQIDL